jgi:hypothetical protein
MSISSVKTGLIVDEFLTSVHYKNLYNNLWYNWTVDNNFYFTINFCGKPDQISDGALATHLFKVDCFLRYITNFIPNINRSKLAQAALNSKFQKILQEIYSDVD